MLKVQGCWSKMQASIGSQAAAAVGARGGVQCNALYCPARPERSCRVVGEDAGVGGRNSAHRTVPHCQARAAGWLGNVLVPGAPHGMGDGGLLWWQRGLLHAAGARGRWTVQCPVLPRKVGAELQGVQGAPHLKVLVQM